MNKTIARVSKVFGLGVVIIVLTFLALERATGINFAKNFDQERAELILKENLKKCPKVIYTGSEYGEGTVTVKCSNGKAYVIYHHISCESHNSRNSNFLLDFIGVSDSSITEVDFNTLQSKGQ
ncbi:hypothetical protein [Allocoleopsis franciscana]|uniref:Uncharacterized protein n=1 Tax=Allocoleopsis franciscana PCC 7113 TaxID=1173027 RepID=K9WKJ1_9CYAN|nr:hypothetical protein [Allocoleopsis franciscana]AFZ20930.1 hypothetical protein Mic7113_5281 [Allocoleopsis franciscana PCC 7113]